MKRKAKHIGPNLVECPFCGLPNDSQTALRWCSKCGTEWYRNRDGDVVFDDLRKTRRFAWGKALNKAGGVSFGTTSLSTEAGEEPPR